MASANVALIKNEYIKDSLFCDPSTSLPKSPDKSYKQKRKREKHATKTFGPSKICPYVIPSYSRSVVSDPKTENERCPYLSDGCRYSHDLDQALREKLPDLPGHCPVLTAVGCCSAGPLCRWESSHSLTELPVIQPTAEIPLNTLTPKLKNLLYKRHYPFERADAIIKTLSTKTDSFTEVENNKQGHVTDEDVIKLRPDEKIAVDFANKLYLAPLTTLGNLPFRRVCKTLGAEVTCGEMALAASILKGQQSEWALLRRHKSEDLFGVQLCGSHLDTVARAAQLIEENCDIDFIDINCGCPIDYIWKKGAGAGLLQHGSRLQTMVRACDQVLRRAVVTVKMRSGVKENKNTAHQLIPGLQRAGAALITIHGRSREQRYSRLADWDYVKQCVQVAHPYPIFGNGDVLSYEDYVNYKEYSGVAGVMIGRGALIKPWIFTEIRDARTWDISAQERLEILRNFTNYGLELWGSDARGVETTRRFLLEWLSFLYRYIPYGILERVPQRINERPPAYIGRNDLETLMASPRSADWIRISEMLLGPVPDGFSFTPKHKANAY